MLFTEGMRHPRGEIREVWALPFRALLVGMPLAFALSGLFAHWVLSLPWLQAALLAAILTPTDPVFASAITGEERIPAPLRKLLDLESGMNDGLALPAVMILMELIGPEPTEPFHLLGEVVFGVLIGLAVPWIFCRLERLSVFATSEKYQPLAAIAVGLLVLALARMTQANEFLGAFTAGVTLVTLRRPLSESFQRVGETFSEVLELVVLLVFGALLTPTMLREIGGWGYLFIILLLLVARPLSIVVALVRSGFTRHERLAASWFGPKGFASLFFALIVFQKGIEGSRTIFVIASVSVAISIILHSSTDVLFARWFHRMARREEREEAEGEGFGEMRDQEG